MFWGDLLKKENFCFGELPTRKCFVVFFEERFFKIFFDFFGFLVFFFYFMGEDSNQCGRGVEGAGSDLLCKRLTMLSEGVVGVDGAVAGVYFFFIGS